MELVIQYQFNVLTKYGDLKVALGINIKAGTSPIFTSHPIPGWNHDLRGDVVLWCINELHILAGNFR